jgi:O-antigen/teichoic acid export membrane protein
MNTAHSAGTATRAKSLLAGLGWNTIGQFLIIAINLALTPFLLHRVGATAYGLFALVSSARGLIGNLDAGLGPTGYRYFPVYVGRGNASMTTSLLVTMLTLLGLVVGVETVAVMVFAPDIAKVFSIGSSLKALTGETAQLFRILMPALLVAALRGPLQRLLMAHHRWAFINYTGIIAALSYAAVALTVSLRTSGLQCLVWGTYAQEAVLTVTTVWACCRYISRQGIRLLPGPEVRQILRFGRKIQIAALASSFNYEVDALLVGALFPVSDVAFYSIGVNFSQQVLNLPVNGLNPITQELGRSFGAGGRAALLGSFADTQRKWVTALAVFPVIAALQGWFGISAWLGHGSQTAAATAAVLILGSTPLLMNSIVDVTAKIVEMPEIESWYLGIGVVMNVALTLPIALRFGVIGVPIGTAIGQVVSFFVCIYLAKRKIGREIFPFFYDVRYVPVLFAAALAALAEWAFRHSMPTGAIGFIACGLLTLPGFLAYYGWVYRGLLLKKFAAREVHEAGDLQTLRHAQGAPRLQRAAVSQDGSGAYASRQLSGLQALMALGGEHVDTESYPSRQLSGVQALMALAEPEVITMMPVTGAEVRLRYTSPVAQYHERQASPAAGQASASGMSRRGDSRR